MTRAAVLALLLGTCNPPGAFTPTFPDNDADHLDAVLERLANAPARSDPAVAIGVTRDPSRLYAWDLREQRIRWEVPAEAMTEPYLAGASVVTHEAQHITARSLISGEVQVSLPDHGMRLVGADGELGLVAYVLSSGEGVAVHSRLVVVTDRVVTFDAEVPQALGRPAVRGGLVFAPWGGQNLSVFDGATGAEVCRLRVADAIVGHAIAHGHQVYFGQRGLGRLTRSILSGSREQFGWFEPAFDGLPGSPAMMRDLYGVPPDPHSAAHRIGLAWSPVGEGDHVGLQSDTLYFVFYKLVFALAAHDGHVRWVHQHRTDVVGTHVLEGGLLVADAMGHLSFLEAEHGRPIWTEDTGMRPGVVQMHIGTFAPEGRPEGEVESVRAQLAAAARNLDSRLILARNFAVARLAQLPDEEVTALLLELCDDESLSAPVRSTACDESSARDNGADAALAMLGRHASFTEGTRLPPLGSLASLSARLADTRAVPLLVAHLRDPATPVEHLLPIFDALGRLGDGDALEPVEQFLRLYHAEEADPDFAAALGRAARASLDLREGVVSETLTAILADPLTMPDAAAAIRVAMGEEQPEVEVVDEEAELGETGPPLPHHITPAVVRALLDPMLPRLRLCLATDERVHRYARVIMVVLDTGEMERITVRPSGAQPCVYNMLYDLELPRTRSRRQQLVYTIRR